MKKSLEIRRSGHRLATSALLGATVASAALLLSQALFAATLTSGQTVAVQSAHPRKWTAMS